ncbi:MAG: hypothetical protein PVI20_18830, partial [Desulfobacteraceae bacterium]
LLGTLGIKFLHTSIFDAFRADEIMEKFSAPLIGYTTLRASLAELINQPVMGPLQFFLQKARHLVWFIALATLFVYLIRTFFYPFFFVFVLGLSGIGTKIRTDRRILYLFILSVFSAVLIYFHILQTWVIGTRFLILFVLPALIFVAFGVGKIIHFLTTRLRLNSKVAFSLVSVFILAFGLAKTVKPRETDKLVFKTIGELIAEKEGNAQVVQLAASMHILRWTSFYANLHYQGAACPQSNGDFEALIGSDYKDFVRNLKGKGIKYFIWEEKHWPKSHFDFLGELNPRDFKMVGTWQHPDTGRLMLFELL